MVERHVANVNVGRSNRLTRFQKNTALGRCRGRLSFLGRWHRNPDSSGVTPLPFEEVRVDALDLVGLLEGDAEVEFDHEIGQKPAIDRHDPRGLQRVDAWSVGVLDIPPDIPPGHAGERLEQFAAFRIIRKSVVLRDNAEVLGEMEYITEEIE